MLYILETELLEKKPLSVALKEIYGINTYYSNYFCKKIGVSNNFKVFELSSDQKIKLIRLIENSKCSINSDLKKSISLEKKKLINIKLYRGLRRIRGFPVRGQRTRSNAKTAKKFRFD